MPAWLGVGGTPASFQRVGMLGLPLMVAIIGGTPAHFRPLVNLYRESSLRAGISEDKLKVGAHAFGYCGVTDQQASDDFFPGYADGSNRIGAERGWPKMTPRSYDALFGPVGALVVGSPETVAAKICHFGLALGGIARFDFQMSPAALHNEQLLASTRLIGQEVFPSSHAFKQ